MHSSDPTSRKTSRLAPVLIAAQLLLAGGVAAASPSPATPSTHSALVANKHVDAGDLNVGYAELGPAKGEAIILLHGWPYDINAYADVAPRLAAQGYRVIVPHLRGYGSTTFRSADAPRNGEPAALASDVIALMDALKIKQANLAGFDWGARSADIVAALWPERVKSLVSVSGSFRSADAQRRRRPNCSGGTSSTSPPTAAVTATRRKRMTSPS